MLNYNQSNKKWKFQILKSQVLNNL